MLNTRSINRLSAFIFAASLLQVAITTNAEARGICGIALGDEWLKLQPLVSDVVVGGDVALLDTWKNTWIPAQRRDIRFRRVCDVVKRTSADGVDMVVETSSQISNKVVMISFQPANMSCEDWNGILTAAMGQPNFSSKDVWEWENSSVKERVALHSVELGECWLTFTRLSF